MKIIAIAIVLMLVGASHSMPCHTSPCPEKPPCPTCK